MEGHRGPAQHDLHGEGTGERAEERIGPARPHAGEGEQQRGERRDHQPAAAHGHGEHAQPQQRPPRGAGGSPGHGRGEQGGEDRIDAVVPVGWQPASAPPMAAAATTSREIGANAATPPRSASKAPQYRFRPPGSNLRPTVQLPVIGHREPAERHPSRLRTPRVALFLNPG